MRAGIESHTIRMKQRWDLHPGPSANRRGFLGVREALGLRLS